MIDLGPIRGREKKGFSAQIISNLHEFILSESGVTPYASLFPMPMHAKTVRSGIFFVWNPSQDKLTFRDERHHGKKSEDSRIHGSS